MWITKISECKFGVQKSFWHIASYTMYSYATTIIFGNGASFRRAAAANLCFKVSDVGGQLHLNRERRPAFGFPCFLANAFIQATMTTTSTHMVIFLWISTAVLKKSTYVCLLLSTSYMTPFSVQKRQISMYVYTT